jgi:hypothetical protein
VQTVPKSRLVGESTMKAASPVAVRLACGEVPAARTVSVACFAPDERGANETVIPQLPPACSVVGQSCLAVNSLELVSTPLIASAVEPAVSVSRVLELLPSATLPRFAVVGARIGGVGLTPVPVSVAVSGLPPSPGRTVSTALRVPASLGLKKTAIGQLSRAFRVAGQWSPTVNSLEPVPMLPSTSADEPAVSVNRVLELPPSVTLPKFAAAGVSVAGVSLIPVPASVAVSGLPPSLRRTVSSALRAPALFGLNVTSIPQLPVVSRAGQS